MGIENHGSRNTNFSDDQSFLLDYDYDRTISYPQDGLESDTTSGQAVMWMSSRAVNRLFDPF